MRFQLAHCIPIVFFTLTSHAAVAADGPAGNAAPEPGQRLLEENGCTIRGDCRKTSYQMTPAD